MTADQLKRLEELCEMWANPDYSNLEHAANVQYVISNEVMDMLPDIIEALKASSAALNAIYMEGRSFSGFGEGYGIAVSMQSIAKHALKHFTPPNDSHAK